MTEPLQHIILILFDIISEGGNVLLVKTVKAVKSRRLNFTNKNKMRLLANTDSKLTFK